jgi:hypothetical protein
MDFNKLISDGWARHDKETATVAGELEQHAELADNADKAAALIALSNHTMGSHGGDWPRALALASRVMAPLAESPELAGPLGHLAVAQFMAGEHAKALASEAASARLSEAESLAMLIRTRVLIALALVDAGRLDEGAAVYSQTIALARVEERKLACDKAIAMTSNNLASQLLEKPARTDTENALMLSAAENAREFWLQCGTWENEERAEYLLALVNNALGRPGRAVEHAQHGLDVISKNGEEVVDEAFLHLTVANACRLQQNREGYERALSRADERAAEWTDAGLKEWFSTERAKVAWKG